MTRFLIYGILLFSLFVNSLFQFGLPKYFAAGSEGLIYLLIFFSLLKRISTGIPNPHLWYSFFFMMIISACSILINGTDPIRGIYSLRLLYRFYFFYLGIIFLQLHETDLKQINKFMGILIILQLPVVAIKFYYYGMSERTIGAYSDVGGSLTTMLPIIVIFYLAAYFFLYRSEIKYIILIIGFVLFSLVGSKRAVAFLYPLQFAVIFYFIILKNKKINLPQKVNTFILIFLATGIVFGSFLYFNDTLNPERERGGSVDVAYAVNYAKEYTTGTDFYGHTTGRYSTTIRTFETLWDSGLTVFFFGFGPGATTVSIFDSAKSKQKVKDFFGRIKIAYGLTTLTKIGLEYGVLGILIFSSIIIVFIRMCIRHYKHENNPYWKAFAIGSVCFSFSMFFFFFGYHFPAFWGDTLPAIYFYAMAVVYTRLREINSLRSAYVELT